MISQTGEYALRAIVCMARTPDQSITAADLATLTEVPRGYLSKVMLQLARSELVRSQRGLNGGFTLARGPEDISILEVLEAVGAAPERIKECPLGLTKHVELCPLHQKLDEASSHIEAVFASTPISEIRSIKKGLGPLCERNG